MLEGGKNCSDLEQYLSALNECLILKNAVSSEKTAECNAVLTVS